MEEQQILKYQLTTEYLPCPRKYWLIHEGPSSAAMAPTGKTTQPWIKSWLNCSPNKRSKTNFLFIMKNILTKMLSIKKTLASLLLLLLLLQVKAQNEVTLHIGDPAP